MARGYYRRDRIHPRNCICRTPIWGLLQLRLKHASETRRWGNGLRGPQITDCHGLRGPERTRVCGPQDPRLDIHEEFEVWRSKKAIKPKAPRCDDLSFVVVVLQFVNDFRCDKGTWDRASQLEAMRNWREGLGVCTPHAWWKVPCAMRKRDKRGLNVGAKESESQKKKERENKGQVKTWRGKQNHRCPCEAWENGEQQHEQMSPVQPTDAAGTDAHALLSSHPRVRVQLAELLIFQEMLDAQLLWGELLILKRQQPIPIWVQTKTGWCSVSAVSPLPGPGRALDKYLSELSHGNTTRLQSEKQGFLTEPRNLAARPDPDLGTAPSTVCRRKRHLSSASQQHHSQTREAAGSPLPSLPHCYSFQNVSCFPFLPATCTS